MLKALRTIRIRFLQKKSKTKFHACVPLNYGIISLLILTINFLALFFQYVFNFLFHFPQRVRSHGRRDKHAGAQGGNFEKDPRDGS